MYGDNRLAPRRSSGSTVLRFRADHPTLRSHEMAGRLSVVLGREVNAGWVRQNLRRARDRFVELIRGEVAHSLGHPSREEVDEDPPLVPIGEARVAREGGDVTLVTWGAMIHETTEAVCPAAAPFESRIFYERVRPAVACHNHGVVGRRFGQFSAQWVIRV